jgi:hypothetical protein
LCPPRFLFINFLEQLQQSLYSKSKGRVQKNTIHQSPYSNPKHCSPPTFPLRLLLMLVEKGAPTPRLDQFLPPATSWICLLGRPAIACASSSPLVLLSVVARSSHPRHACCPNPSQTSISVGIAASWNGSGAAVTCGIGLTVAGVDTHGDGLHRHLRELGSGSPSWAGLERSSQARVVHHEIRPPHREFRPWRHEIRRRRQPLLHAAAGSFLRVAASPLVRVCCSSASHRPTMRVVLSRQDPALRAAPPRQDMVVRVAVPGCVSRGAGVTFSLPQTHRGGRKGGWRERNAWEASG